MDREQLVEMLAEQPFTPLSLCMTDGRVRTITHPELAIVADKFVVVVFKSGDKTLGCFCDLKHISAIERTENEMSS